MIGIVTWYKNLNYGGSLQAFALQQSLRAMGYESELIDWVPRREAPLTRFGKDAAFAALYPQGAASRRLIKRFIRERLTVSERIKTKEELRRKAESCDKIICGSDQIWTPANGTPGYYFLDFCASGQKIAYAPSMGILNATPDYERAFAEAVKDFPSLSVREFQMRDYIRKLTGREAEIVCDPTLLLTAEQWRREARNPPRDMPPRYLLGYFLSRNPHFERLVMDFAEARGLPLYYVSAGRYRLPGARQAIAGCAEFLRLLDNAEYICTDSYHGMCLGFVLRKRVISFQRFSPSEPLNQNSRVESLCTLLGFPDSYLVPQSRREPLEEPEPMPEETYRRLHELRESSLAYLERALTRCG